jgi:hypothetical protein
MMDKNNKEIINFTIDVLTRYIERKLGINCNKQNNKTKDCPELSQYQFFSIGEFIKFLKEELEIISLFDIVGSNGESIGDSYYSDNDYYEYTEYHNNINIKVKNYLNILKILKETIITNSGKRRMNKIRIVGLGLGRNRKSFVNLATDYIIDLCFNNPKIEKEVYYYSAQKFMKKHYLDVIEKLKEFGKYVDYSFKLKINECRIKDFSPDTIEDIIDKNFLYPVERYIEYNPISNSYAETILYSAFVDVFFKKISILESFGIEFPDILNYSINISSSNNSISISTTFYSSQNNLFQIIASHTFEPISSF